MITTGSLTGGEIAGAGLFDELMRTTKSHVVAEFDAGRITEKNYSTVYLGAIQANLQTASQFVLGYETQNQQILLLQEQIQGADLDNQLKTDSLLTSALQRDLLTEQIATQEQSRLKLVEDTKLVTQQIAQSTAQADLVRKQIEQIALQMLLTTEQTALITEQILTEEANTKTPTAGLAKASYDKTLAEIEVLEQKRVTEEAQTSGSGSSIGGIVGQDIKLKEAQANSFIRDAEQKAAKFYSDVLSIAYSVDTTNTNPALWGMGPADANAVMAKVREGINVYT